MIDLAVKFGNRIWADVFCRIWRCLWMLYIEFVVDVLLRKEYF